MGVTPIKEYLKAIADTGYERLAVVLPLGLALLCWRGRRGGDAGHRGGGLEVAVDHPLLVRGGESDLLTRETAQQMTQRGPKAELVELPGIGHAPTFMHDDQIALAREFFLG